MAMTVDDTDRAAFRDAVTRRLDEIGHKQSWLAVRVADEEGREEPYSQAHISDWLSGRRQPSPPQVFALERALKARAGSLSRLLGYLPADARSVTSVEDAVRVDPHLTDRHRAAIISLYRALSDPGQQG